VVGSGWAVVKWWFFVKDLFRDYKRKKSGFLRKKNLDPDGEIPDEYKGEWGEETTGWGAIEVPPKVGSHKGRIMLWMCWWPWSMVWTIINDPVRRMFSRIYDLLEGLFQKIADRAFAAAMADTPSEEQAKEYRKKREEEQEEANRRQRDRW